MHLQNPLLVYLFQGRNKGINLMSEQPRTQNRSHPYIRVLVSALILMSSITLILLFLLFNHVDIIDILPASNPVDLSSSTSDSIWDILFLKNELNTFGGATNDADIYLLDIESQTELNLTSNSYDDKDAAWSPNGNNIIFASNRTGNYEIYLSTLDGIITQLTNNSFDDYAPAISSDGEQIAFVSERDGSPTVYLMDNTGGNQRSIYYQSNHFVPLYELTWLGNDQYLAWIDEINIIIYDLNQSTFLTRRYIADGLYYSGGPARADDGSRYIYAGNYYYSGRIHAAPDGTVRFAFSNLSISYTGDSFFPSIYEIDSEDIVRIISIGIEPPNTFFREPWSNQLQVAWSPDGTMIAHIDPRNTYDTNGLFVTDLNTNSSQELIQDRTFVDTTGGLTWSPDSQYLAFVADRDSHREIWIVDRNGSELHYVTFNEFASEYSIVWRPNLSLTNDLEASNPNNQISTITTTSPIIIPTALPASPTTSNNAASLELDIELASIGVTSNEEWQELYPNGFVREFNGVPMVLVPAGCFQMGNDPHAYYWDGDNYVLDVPDGSQQCFDEPFWIDQSEVTQAQFRALGGTKGNTNFFTGDNRPVEFITWFEARDYCENQRGGHLPTEAQWEYAARGPDALFFPWGNDWNENNAVWNTNSTSDVGSIPAGVSWVGAFDLSGNVQEWTRSVYENYPYDADDGREDNRGESANVLYTLRGGSWDYINSLNLRPSLRVMGFPDYRDITIGFRCVLSYNSSDQIQGTDNVTIINDPTMTATNDPEYLLQEALRLANSPVSSNAQWQESYPNGFVNDFGDGVPMVLVPAGCFQMGSSEEQVLYAIDEFEVEFPNLSDETPVTQICFDEPFWIDQTEVTQEAFIRLSGEPLSSNNVLGFNLPVNSISWFDARDFCDLRGIRLPSEAEWEYVARGVDNLTFPWGNEFDSSRTNFCDVTCEAGTATRDLNDGYRYTSPVGAYPSGASWVGALDMSGNVYELTNSIYVPYPYIANDGRERRIPQFLYNFAHTFRDYDLPFRVLRGGSLLESPFNLRAADRSVENRSYGEPIGFRCARSVD